MAPPHSGQTQFTMPDRTFSFDQEISDDIRLLLSLPSSAFHFQLLAVTSAHDRFLTVAVATELSFRFHLPAFGHRCSNPDASSA